MEFGDDALKQWIDKLPESCDRVRKKLQNDKTREDALNELAVGYLLKEELHYEVEYEKEFEGLTPDWYVHSKDQFPAFFIEVLTRNPSDEMKERFIEAFKIRHAVASWPQVLDKKINEKLNKYRNITERDIPFVVGVAANFFSCVEIDDLINTCWRGLFIEKPDLSGVIWIERTYIGRSWVFAPLYNQNANNPLRNNAIGLESIQPW